MLGQAQTAEGVTHSITLMPEVRRLLDNAGVSPKEIDLFVAGVGPGSFTGLRIGLAAAKGLARAAGKPLVGAPSLDVLAKGLPHADYQVLPTGERPQGPRVRRAVRTHGRRIFAPDRIRFRHVDGTGGHDRPAHDFFRRRSGRVGEDPRRASGRPVPAGPGRNWIIPARSTRPGSVLNFWRKASRPTRPA